MPFRIAGRFESALHHSLSYPHTSKDLALQLFGGGLILGVAEVQTVREPFSGKAGDKGAFANALGTVQHEHGIKLHARLLHTANGGTESLTGDSTDIHLLIILKSVHRKAYTLRCRRTLER